MTELENLLLYGVNDEVGSGDSPHTQQHIPTWPPDNQQEGAAQI